MLSRSIILLDSCLARLNDKRAMHRMTPIVTWNINLQASAQAWARQLATERTSRNSPSSARLGVGENVFALPTGSSVSPQQLCLQAVETWYFVLLI